MADFFIFFGSFTRTSPAVGFVSDLLRSMRCSSTTCSSVAMLWVSGSGAWRVKDLKLKDLRRSRTKEGARASGALVEVGFWGLEVSRMVAITTLRRRKRMVGER